MIPVYLSFLSILQGVLNGVITPLVEVVLREVVGMIMTIAGKLIKEIMYSVFLQVFRVLLKTLYFVEKTFDILSGMANVTVMDGKTVKQTTSLLGYFLQMSSISRALAAMSITAAALAFLFAMYQTIKSMSDSVMSSEFKPISKVLGDGIRCAIAFMLVPFLCIMCLQLSSALMKSVNTAFVEAAQSSETGQHRVMEMDDAIFMMAAECALKEGKGQKYQDFWAQEKPFQSEQWLNNGAYDLKNIDYFTGILSSAILLFMVLVACMTFIRRIIQILMLYIVSPYFSATIALDGGAKFNKWRESFVGAFFGCFGSIFAMKIFLMIMPLISDDTISFSTNVTMNTVAKMLFILGGAWSIMKCQDMITSLIDPESASQQGENLALVAGVGLAAGKGVGNLGGKAMDALKKKSGGSGAGGGGGFAGGGGNKFSG